MEEFAVLYPELYRELIAKELGKMMLNTLDGAQVNCAEIVADVSYQALQKIKAVIEDDSLSEFDCIGQIVSIFEELGTGGGARHNW